MKQMNVASSSRRRFLQSLALLPAAAAAQSLPGTLASTEKTLVRDRFWIWGHEAHCFDNSYGLPRNGRITPVEGAHYLGTPNIIFIRYDGKPAPPFEQYAVPFKSLKRVDWSIAGVGGVTSEEERAHVFRLAAALPNLTGLFMDDFFRFNTGGSPNHWLATNNPHFPVTVDVELPAAADLTAVVLTQSDWPTGDYRSGDFVVEVSDAAGGWKQAAKGTLPNRPGAKTRVALGGAGQSRVRIGILNTHDKQGARSCGLSGVELWAGDKPVSLQGARWRASSSYKRQGPERLGGAHAIPEAPAGLSIEQLREVRQKMTVNGRHLDLGVTLYTHQLDPCIRPHLDLCDVISLWTWESKDLAQLEENFGKLKALAPAKRIRLGCYMWDFGAKKPMPLAEMRKQCEFGLSRLRAGEIEGMIFLASNICDLDLEAVEWSRHWIAEVGSEPL